jgi:undecaprenyl-diphosphatase
VLEPILVSLIRSFTEFIAVGSSGHTILLREVFGVESTPGADLAIRAGMIVSVLAAYRRDLRAMAQSILTAARHPFRLTEMLRHDAPLRECVFLAVGTAPAAVLGLWYGRDVALWATDLKLVSTFVIIGGLLLFLTRLFRWHHPQPLSIVRALLVGFGQALAIVPGLPRMSAALSVGVYAGLAPSASVRFSVLLAVPALAGVLIMGLLDAPEWSWEASSVLVLAGAFIAAGAVGWFAIRVIEGAVRTGAIRFIAIYCLLIGLLGIIFL